MGRSSDKEDGVEDHPLLWAKGELPQTAPKLPDQDHRPVRFPLWTQNKAKLIEEYLRLFVYITHHGNYIDGFAAPQEQDHPDTWAAKRVLEFEPKWFRQFWLCDISPSGIEKLNALKAEHENSKRKIEVVPGDFNVTVKDILASGHINEKTATFALLDQRTFECEWQTVVALSKHKTTTKIEIFYFFATGWIDRSIAAVKATKTAEKVERWWGRSDWRSLRKMNGTVRAKLVADRFENELGYGKATMYAIHSQKRGGRIMYHMIHATDHPDATLLMVRAYRKVSGRSELENELAQTDFDDIWRRLEADED